MSTTVALVGRTNVGKSSLFNKLAKSKSALVSEQEGLTRDIKSTSIHLGGKSINLIDTGGFFTSKDDDFEEMILSKAYEAIVKGDMMPKPGIPESFNVLMHELKGLGLSVSLD